MSQTYNSKYYVDIFKWLLEKKLKKTNKDVSLIFNDLNIPLNSFFAPKTERSKSSKFIKQSKNKEINNDKKNIRIPERNQQEMINFIVLKNNAQIYNAEFDEKLAVMKKKKESQLNLRKQQMEEKQKSKEQKFRLLLEDSKRSLSEKIQKNSSKRNENFERSIKNRLKYETLLESKMQKERTGFEIT